MTMEIHKYLKLSSLTSSHYLSILANTPNLAAETKSYFKIYFRMQSMLRDVENKAFFILSFV